MKIERIFKGTFSEVKQQLAAWKSANRTCKIVREGAPVASGDKPLLLDEPVWALTIEYEPDPPRPLVAS
jgi:hypothetical protein